MNVIKLARALVEKYSELVHSDDTSFGPVIPGARAKFLRDNLAKLFLDLIKGELHNITQLYGASLPDLTRIEDRMIDLTNKVDQLPLLKLYETANSCILSLNEIRKDLHKNINHYDMARTIDGKIFTIQQKMWKYTKQIISSPQLKGTEFYTWYAGPGRSPVNPITVKPKTEYKKLMDRLTDPNAPFKDLYERLEQKKRDEIHGPTFQQYEDITNLESNMKSKPKGK